MDVVSEMGAPSYLDIMPNSATSHTAQNLCIVTLRYLAHISVNEHHMSLINITPHYAIIIRQSQFDKT